MAQASLTRLEIVSNDALVRPMDPRQWQGTPVVLYFWGEWCRACLRSTPEVVGVAERHPDVRFVFVNTDTSPKALSVVVPGNVVDARVDAASFGPEIMRKRAFRFVELGLVFGIPAYYVIDATGVVRHAGNGSRFAAALPGLLKGLSPSVRP